MEPPPADHPMPEAQANDATDQDAGKNKARKPNPDEGSDNGSKIEAIVPFIIEDLDLSAFQVNRNQVVIQIRRMRDHGFKDPIPLNEDATRAAGKDLIVRHLRQQKWKHQLPTIEFNIARESATAFITTTATCAAELRSLIARLATFDSIKGLGDVFHVIPFEHLNLSIILTPTDRTIILEDLQKIQNQIRAAELDHYLGGSEQYAVFKFNTEAELLSAYQGILAAGGHCKIHTTSLSAITFNPNVATHAYLLYVDRLIPKGGDIHTLQLQKLIETIMTHIAKHGQRPAGRNLFFDIVHASPTRRGNKGSYSTACLIIFRTKQMADDAITFAPIIQLPTYRDTKDGRTKAPPMQPQIISEKVRALLSSLASLYTILTIISRRGENAARPTTKNVTKKYPPASKRKPGSNWLAILNRSSGTLRFTALRVLNERHPLPRRMTPPLYIINLLRLLRLIALANIGVGISYEIFPRRSTQQASPKSPLSTTNLLAFLLTPILILQGNADLFAQILGTCAILLTVISLLLLAGHNRGQRGSLLIFVIIAFLLLLPGVGAVPIESSSGSTLVHNETLFRYVTFNTSSALSNHKDALVAFANKGDYDAIATTETGFAATKIRRNKSFYENFLPNYSAIHIAPEGTKGGDTPQRKGISLFIHDKWLPFLEKPLDNEDNRVQELNLIHVSIKHRQKPIHIIALYGTPQGGPSKTQYWQGVRKWYIKLAGGEQNVSKLKAVILGDFNVAPNARLDRSPPHENECDCREFDNTIEQCQLTDVWRTENPEETAFTFSSLGTTSQSRIDLALASPAIYKHIEKCEILSPKRPLTHDHVPVEITVKLSQAYRDSVRLNVSVPELTLRSIDVKKLSDPEKQKQFQEELETIDSRIVEQKGAIEGYEYLTAEITRAATTVLGEKIRTLNRKKSSKTKSSAEKLSELCTSVVLSRNHLLSEVLNGQPLKITRKMTSLLNRARHVDALQSPKEDFSYEEAAAWFRSVNRIKEKIDEEIRENEAASELERILHRIDTLNGWETNAQRRWFQKASFFKDTNAKKQTFVTPELGGADTVQIIVTDPEKVKQGIGSYWRDLFNVRTKVGEDDDPWFRTKTMEENRKKLANARSLMGRITREELEARTAALANNKASGIDGLPGELIRALPANVIDALLVNFSQILVEKELPKSWKHSSIYTLHKSGDVSKCSNYRPISLTCVLYKVFMGIMNSRLTEVVEENRILSEAQGGFRKGRGCTDKINLLINLVKLNKTKGDKTHICFVDIVKAFDSVPHDHLVKHLQLMGFEQTFVDLLAEIYKDNEAHVITVFGDTQTFAIRRGVRQGCPMSPMLFDLFLEPMLQWIAETEGGHTDINAFCDDLAIISTTRPTLQDTVNKVEAYFQCYNLEMGVSANKSKTVYMTDSSENGSIEYERLRQEKTDAGTILHRTGTRAELPKMTGKESYKYLGLWFNIDLDWNIHLAKATAKLESHIAYVSNAYYTKRQAIVIANRVMVPYVTYAADVIPTPDVRTKKWDLRLNQMVNRKGKISVFSKAVHNHLPVDQLGEGLISTTVLTRGMWADGQLRRALISNDRKNAKLARAQWEGEGRKTELLPDEKGKPTLRLIENEPIGADESHLAFHRFFKAGDPCLSRLRKLGLRSMKDITLSDGRLKPINFWLTTAERQQPFWERTYTSQLYNDVRDQLCIPKIDLLHPILRYRIYPTNGFAGIQHLTLRETVVSAWTDGSKKNDSVTYSVHLPNTAVGHAVRVIPEDESGGAELRAAVTALLLHDPYKELVIYIDNMRVIDMLSDIEAAIRTETLNRCYLFAAKDVLAYRTRLGRSTKFLHVYSHLLDPDNHMTAKEKERKMTIMRQRYGDEAEMIMQGNRTADAMADKAHGLPLNLHLEEVTQWDPEFVAVNSRGARIRSIKKEALERHEKVMIAVADADPRLAWRTSGLVDIRRSSAIIKDRDRKHAHLQNFAARARRALFADKATRIQRQDQEFWKSKYRGIVVTDDKCDLCGKTEDRFHFAVCRQHSNRRAETRANILTIINEHLTERCKKFPCFWDRELKQDNEQEGWNKVEEFPPELAARGLLPYSLFSFLQVYTWKQGVDKEEIMRGIQIEVLKCFQESWAARCKEFYRKHKKEMTTADDLRRGRLEASGRGYG